MSPMSAVDPQLFKSKEIDDFQRQLNLQSIVPCRGYRRNHQQYPLFCYVNNITGCWLSENLSTLAAFIRRARKHMDRYPSNNDWQAYHELVKQYLDGIEKRCEAFGVAFDEYYQLI